MEWDEKYREMFAALAHEQWSGWMQCLFSKGEFLDKDGTWVMPSELVERWQRQMHTAYDDLPEDEKQSDRVEADKMMTIVNARCNDICPTGE